MSRAVGYLVAAAAVFSAVAIDGQLWHWSTLPSLGSVILGTRNLMKQVNRPEGIFGPRAWVEGFSIYFFGLAPLLHVSLDSYGSFAGAPSDWRYSLGVMSCLNLIGLLVRTIVWDRAQGPASKEALFTENRGLDLSRPVFRADLLILASAVSFLLILLAVGGPAGYLAASGSRLGGFAGLGSLLLIADILPSAILLRLALRVRQRARQTRLSLSLLLPLLVLQLAVGGLRGSRIQILFFGFLALGLLHWAGQRVTARLLVFGVVIALVFSYGYGFYKTIGPTLFSEDGRSQVVALNASGDRNLTVLLLGDMGRSDVQAILWQRVEDPEARFRLRGGRTYVDDLIIHVPSFVRPTLSGFSKTEAGTELLVPNAPEGFRVGYIYGVAGEAMLNFGRLAALPALVFYALLTAPIIRWCSRGDLKRRSMMFPPVIILLVVGLMSDLDQVIYMSIRFGLAPLFVFRSLRILNEPYRKSSKRFEASGTVRRMV